MDPVQVVVLAVLQGIVEFLPISSSGHLVLVPALLGWEDQGLAFDIAVHLGTLSAVVAYFRRDIVMVAAALFRQDHPQARLAWSIIIGTLPLGVVGFMTAHSVAGLLRSPAVIAATTGGFGVLLWVADRFARAEGREHELGWGQVVFIGLAQALALVPGTSRSGITITAGLAMGLSRRAAARFSFLLAIPAIAMAAVWQLAQFLVAPVPVQWLSLIAGAVLAGAVAFAAIAVFLRLIERLGLWPFAVYRLVLAGVIAYVLL